MGTETMAEAVWESLHDRICRGLKNARKIVTLTAIASDVGLTRQTLHGVLGGAFLAYPNVVRVEKWLIESQYLEPYGDAKLG